ncbi:hypothetical protein FC62_GL000097 [Amylolactobacillus amylotrophicus DSM 20534]|uniref:Chromosome partitioning protein ParB n=3 Tax=Amylolactobacillus TaxID=2767876 RepID=A0A1L6XA77_9LACO|nr:MULTISPECIES: ParB/RepB/Spo0J family partition protein [Amylolactobacillus]APT17881.1 chromosome partitioning protein ParB [Amylolactobacillus amylophilus DSM 20533 = JCM 1125]KRK38413.1 hypothetical protein FC62_GL000097 [Amylolactobacillus amylotrophicus DSM 20534]KRM42944.1 hypothetical protein FD40_GL000742 [Amylolactobacillus amylophilus DSM 20533 = JCM 1125]GED79810.1 hypothetical protein LAM01_02830 [Amylolactobacillus amylophilus]
MDLLEMKAANQLEKTGVIKKLSVPGIVNHNFEVCSIPLKYLYYNDQNGRINTTYKQFQAENGLLIPEPGDSQYNKIFEKFIYQSNIQALKDTLQSIKEKGQQEPGVVLPDGRVIDGNRRFTALRMYQTETNLPQEFDAIILPLDLSTKTDEKKIKELELDLQLGREERVNYDPIDRIFDVYNTIEVEKLMTVEEYRKASGAGNTKGINRDIRLANLVIRFIRLISPGGNPIDKFYLARDLKLDGPLEEIESTINNLKSDEKEAITDAVLVHLAVLKTKQDSKDATRDMRDLKKYILKNPESLDHYVQAVDDKMDSIIDKFEEHPVTTANDLQTVLHKDDEIHEEVEKLKQSTNRLIYKGKNDSERKKALTKLEDIRDNLEDISVDDFKEMTIDENLDSKEVMSDITDILFKLKKELNMK